jgi:excisionase family DNA binding protein
MAPALYDVPTAAAVLNVSVHTLRKWVRERRIPVTRLGRAVRFDPRALERFVERNTLEALER